MTEVNGQTYKYLEARPGSNYRQLFYKGKNPRAEILYRLTVGVEPRAPEEVARDYHIPVEAFQEAIHFCIHNEPLLRQEREQTIQRIREAGLDKPSYVPPEYRQDVTID